MTNPKSILFYDGHCAICRKVKTFIQFCDIQKKIQLVDLWEIDSSNKFNHLKIQDLAKEIHLINQNGEIFTGYFAFKQIAKQINLFSPFYLLSFLPGTNYLGVRVYKFISENRYRLGCETCGKLYCKIHPFH